jgi:hypothetical protein
MAGFDIALFRRQLAETITWCGKNFAPEDVEGSLRTLTPPPPSSLLGLSGEERESWIHGTITQRSKELQEKKQTLLTNLSVGRLLIFYPDFSPSDGIVSAVSKGYIDSEYFPARDSWVYYDYEHVLLPNKAPATINYLISWVPPQIIDLVDEAIEDDPTQSLQWLSDTRFDFIFLKSLQKYGLLF